MENLKGKVALVTGGNSGIGLATAQLLCNEGAKVAISGRDRKTLDQAVALLGNGTFGFVSDVSSPAELDKLFQSVSDRLGKIDILFANAGVAKFAPIVETSEALYDEIFDINVKGTFFTVKKSLPYLNDGAAIILTTSFANQAGLPGSSVYAASKAAL